MDIYLEEYNNAFVLYFGTETTRINAYTLATTLVSFADAVKYANNQINPGYEVEVVVESLADGSFKAQIGALYKGAGNLFSKENAKAIALSVVAAYIYQNTLAPEDNVKVIVNDDQVVIEEGDRRVVVPREVHDAMKELEEKHQFRSNVGRGFRAIAEDPAIDGFGITGRIDDSTPELQIPKERVRAAAEDASETEVSSREIEEIVELQIVRAILERGKRRWEFVWRGVKIAAPVLDERFYDDFAAHKIMIAPGDMLRAKMRIQQEKDLDTGIFLNKRYEVLEIHKHIPKMQQRSVDFGVNQPN
ncbi:hypothetical protein [Thioalkalivibrio sp. ALRh]|uniref:hypothetical protein n=1 Tax=Thioalkalivibrio sp. ALRh TaxID=1266911 RepID=UPI00036BFC9F|nr:hypothetical protein [Thioalkalivibrio sp. ALRh]